MSMELEVFSDSRLAQTAEWQRAIDAEGYALHLEPDVRIEDAKGFVPVTLGDKQTGFECFHDDADETMKHLGAENFSHRWRFALGLRWVGSSMDELQAAWMAATAYAAATGGVVFDSEEGGVLTAEQARETVRDILRDLPRMEEAMAEIMKRFPAQKP